MKRLFIAPLFALLTLSGCVGTDLVTPNLEKLELINPITSLAVGETYIFEIKYTSPTGNVEPISVFWISSDELIASVTQNGEVTGNSMGEVTLFYTANNLEESITFDVSDKTIEGVTKTAFLQGSSGYTASGTATLLVDKNNELIVELSSDFKTDFALGTFIYLANSTTGQEVKSSGLDLGQVTSGGAKTFNVSMIDSGVGINTYSHIVVLCKPAGISFGFGEFK